MWIGELFRRMRYMSRRAQFDADLEEEMRLHVDLRADETGDRDAARRRFGNSTLIHERSRELWSIGSAIGALAQDAKFGMRSFAKTRGFTALAVLTLALGIGSSTAVFSLIDAILLRPLPYPHAERIVLPWRMPPPGANLGFEEFPWGGFDFNLFKQNVTTLEHMGAFKADSFNLTGSGEPRMLEGIRASVGFFGALGVQPSLGRFYTPEEDRQGREFEVILSDRLWRTQFASDRKVLGRAIELNGFSYTIVGVMPPQFAFPRASEMPGSFNFPREPDLWVPLAIPDVPRGPADYAVIGRVRPGVSVEQVQAEMDLCSDRLDKVFPTPKGWFRSRVTALQKQVSGDARRPLLLTLMAVSVVLLIACSNVANLLLIRSLARSREFTMRAALGAGRVRLISQLLTESLLLAGGAGALGIAIAAAALDFATKFGPESIPRLADAQLNWHVFAFALGAAMITGLLFGLVPAIDAARNNLVDTLKDGSRGTAGGARPKIRNALLVFQVALALMLVIAAGLLVRSFREILRVDGGFNPQSVISFKLSLPASKYADRARIVALFDDLLRRLNSIPGVTAAGISETVPMGGTGESTVVTIIGHTFDPNHRPVAAYTIASPGYFAAVGTPILRGRPLLESDREETTPVTVISKSMAEKFWPGEDALGKKVGLGSPRYPVSTVVGIAADVKHLSLREGGSPEMYVPYAQKAYPSMLVMRVTVRTKGDSEAASAYIREAVRVSDRDLPIAELATLREIVDRSLTQPRFAMLVIAGFGGLALILAAIGRMCCR
jgi:putative ABC transport system permease protein